jgi:hypothetical protein
MAWAAITYLPTRKVEQAVRDRLRDPDSAIFRDVHYYSNNQVGCGMVNAKNGMGGYVGYRAFILFPDGDLRFEPEGTGEFGLPEQRLEAAQKTLNFITLAQQSCRGTVHAASSP